MISYTFGYHFGSIFGSIWEVKIVDFGPQNEQTGPQNRENGAHNLNLTLDFQGRRHARSALDK